MIRFSPAHSCLLALAWLAPAVASGQTSTTDGIRAVAAGDYFTAAHILQPLAEGAQDPDPLAQFFLAILADANQGVNGNPFRTCALYLRAAMPTNPFMNQSLALARAIQERTTVGPEAPPLCGLEDDERVPPMELRSGAPLAVAGEGIAAGIEAISRSDYAQAAEIFLPVLKSPQPDHAAEFFLAMMYENGLGVPSDLIRACALYERASVGDAGPLEIAGQSLFRSMSRSLSRDAFEDCQISSLLGFDHRFRPETFWLEPGHSISLDLKGATITDNGEDTRVDLQLYVPGAMYLPMRHTELAAGAQLSARRHFVEVFMWLPDKQHEEWTLVWRLFEVMSKKLEPVTVQELTKVRTPEPPTDDGTFDVRKFVDMRVNERGDAEWAVIDDDFGRSDVIETETERQAAAKEARTRKETEDRMDWTKVADAHRAPTLAYPEVKGCGDVEVYGWSSDRTEAISIRADKVSLQLSTTPVTFDGSIQQSGLEVMTHVYAAPMREQTFCTDVGGSAVEEETWTLVRGAVAVVLSPPGALKRAPLSYRATIQITGAEFMNASGDRIKQATPLTLTAIVGSLSR